MLDLKLLNWEDAPTIFSVRDLEYIRKIVIDVITGDEVARIYYRDGSTEVLDSSDRRFMDFHDTSYVLYDERTEGGLLFDKKWLDRKSSYWYEDDESFEEDDCIEEELDV